jgi:hypothetical protein
MTTESSENVKVAIQTGSIIVGEYSASVFTAAGWRSVTITAHIKLLTPKTGSVVQVLAIDGEEPTGYTSRTGSKRQRYNAAGIAARELGKKKRLASLLDVKAVA